MRGIAVREAGERHSSEGTDERQRGLVRAAMSFGSQSDLIRSQSDSLECRGTISLRILWPMSNLSQSRSNRT